MDFRLYYKATVIKTGWYWHKKRNMPRHRLIKLSKIKYKEKIFEAAREKQQITHKGIPIRLTADLSAATLQA